MGIAPDPVTEPLPSSGAGSSRNRLHRYPSPQPPARNSHPRTTPPSRKPAFSKDFCHATILAEPHADLAQRNFHDGDVQPPRRPLAGGVTVPYRPRSRRNSGL